MLILVPRFRCNTFKKRINCIFCSRKNDSSGLFFSGPEIPDHKFVFRNQELQSGPKKGQIRKTVSLVIPPYLFCRKTNAREIGGLSLFTCNTCMRLDVKNYAHCKYFEDKNGEAYYELIKWPTDHVCDPAVSNHLVKEFKDKCYDAVSENPGKTSFNPLYLYSNVVQPKFPTELRPNKEKILEIKWSKIFPK